MNGSINKDILILGLNSEIGSRLKTLKNRVDSWHEYSRNAEDELFEVIYETRGEV